MNRVQSILTRKGSALLSTDSDKLVINAVRKMAEAGCGSILVVDEGKLVGIFTERDYLRRIALEGRRSTETKIADVMTSDLIVVGPDETVEQCMAIMTERRIRHLPVMSGEQVAGVVSIGDLVRQISRQQAEQIRHLTDYVSGGYPR